ncbi:MAG: DUF2911 domain-containing protein [Cytophagales bacterium]|nr:DUF2911 domain-containing protein [Cytophagales bacterium]
MDALAVYGLRTRVACILFAACSLVSVQAQIDHPRSSPPATLIQTIGRSQVKVEYARPSARGRTIMGDLIPYGRIWRVGANESTKVHFSDSVTLGGHRLEPGVYALYAIPHADEWIIIIHRNTSHWGDGRFNYKQDEDALRFVARPEPSGRFTETFTIAFDEVTHNSAVMVLAWERTRIGFQVVFNTRAKMLDEIGTQIKKNPTADTFYEAARYLLEEEILPDRARAYLAEANALAGDTYYIHRVWALVEAQLKNYQEAIRHAKLSRDLAAKQGKDEFVRMNEKSIEEWKKR